jgi:hypothetical protein
VAQNTGIGFSGPNIMVSDLSLAMDVDAPSSMQPHAVKPFTRQMVSISKAEHI